MSYCRFSSDDWQCDVYVYANPERGRPEEDAGILPEAKRNGGVAMSEKLQDVRDELRKAHQEMVRTKNEFKDKISEFRKALDESDIPDVDKRVLKMLCDAGDAAADRIEKELGFEEA